MSMSLLPIAADNTAIQAYAKKMTLLLESNDHVVLYYDEYNDALLVDPHDGKRQSYGVEYAKVIATLSYRDRRISVWRPNGEKDVHLSDDPAGKLVTILKEILQEFRQANLVMDDMENEEDLD